MSPSDAPASKRNFILQQGLCEPAAESCATQYSALMFQPWIVGVTVVAATLLQARFVFFLLAAGLWWSALFPRLNPFEAVYNLLRGRILTPAPAPRRFSQFLAGSFALAIAVSLSLGWRATALVLEGFFLLAIAALVLGGFCLGAFVFHVLQKRADFARRTLPWAGD